MLNSWHNSDGIETFVWLLPSTTMHILLREEPIVVHLTGRHLAFINTTAAGGRHRATNVNKKYHLKLLFFFFSAHIGVATRHLGEEWSANTTWRFMKGQDCWCGILWANSESSSAPVCFHVKCVQCHITQGILPPVCFFACVCMYCFCCQSPLYGDPCCASTMISLKMNKEALAFLVPVWPPKPVGIMRYFCNRYNCDNLMLLLIHLRKKKKKKISTLLELWAI